MAQGLLSCTWLTFLCLRRVPTQTSIITDGFRSLAEGEQVEFYVETGDDGRTKAVQVTGPGGAPPLVRACSACVRSQWFCCEDVHSSASPRPGVVGLRPLRPGRGV